MGDIRQSVGERQRLREIWEGHPNVKQFKADVEQFAVAKGLKFNPDGMTAICKFAAAWISKCDDWPDSGILIG